MEFVVLVDRDNKKVGVEEKLKAHIDGKLHRAFSILVFNSKGELLLQQRAKSKYHCPGLWSNTCCSHPRPGESYFRAVHRRLREEMGFDCALKKHFCFVYKAKFSNGLTEHEHDTVFVGRFDGKPELNRKEAMAYRWMPLDELKKDIKAHPAKYTYWFKKALKSKLFKQSF
ncbi:MAG: isopentenyl-diphosphate Delta-isomerase [Candidatus Woesearchaeota archaeon]